MPDNNIVTVIIVDDHLVVRKGLMAFFAVTDDIKVLGLAANAQEAVKVVQEHKPQVVLLDLFLPDQPAVETIRQIKALSPESQVVLLTSHEGDEYVADVLKAGAISYVLKDISPEDLIVAIKKAASGERTLHPRLAQAIVKGLDTESKKLYESLTEREREVMHFIAQGLTNGEIAENLYISETTVKSHVRNILGKLYLADRTKVAVYAWREGLIKEPH